MLDPLNQGPWKVLISDHLDASGREKLWYLSGGSGKTVKHCTRIGNANVLITVIFPKRDIFLRDQSLKKNSILFDETLFYIMQVFVIIHPQPQRKF
jgi:hypothetical protein